MNGFDEAARQLERRAALGRLVWSAGGGRCYERQDGAAAVLTLTRDGFPVLVSEYAGVDVGALR